MAEVLDPTLPQAAQGFNLAPSVDEGLRFQETVGIRDEPPGWWSSFFSGFGSANLVIEGVRAATTERPTFKADFNYNPLGDILDDQSPASAYRDLAMGDENAAEALLAASSHDELMHIGDQISAKYARIASAFANPVAGVVGMLAGGMFDIAALLPAVGALRALQVGANTARAARMATVSRLALLGGADAATFTALESASDPTIDFTDVLSTAAIGVAAGGLLGSVLPSRLAGVHVNKGGIMTLDDSGDALQEAAHRMSTHAQKPKSVSASVAPDNADRAIADAVDRITPESAPVVNDMTSPVGRAQTMSKVAQKDLAPKGYTAPDQAYTLFNDLVPNRATNEAETLGVARRSDAYSINDELTGLYRRHDTEVHTAWTEARRGLTHIWGMRETRWGIKVPTRRLSNREFEHIVDNFRHAEANENDLDVIWMGDRFDFTVPEREAMMPAIRRAAASRNAQDLEARKLILDSGLASEDDFMRLKNGELGPYTPQFLNMEAVAEDRGGLKEMLRMFYQREPMPQFLVERGFVEGIEEIGPDGEKVVRAAKTFQQLDPEVREEAAQSWNRLMIQGAEENAQRLANEAADMSGVARGQAMSIVVQKMADRVRDLRRVRDTHAERYNRTMERIKKLEAKPKFKPSATHAKRYETAERSLRLQRQAEEALDTAEGDLEFVFSRRRQLDDVNKFINRYTRDNPKLRKLAREANVKGAKAERLQAKIDNEIIAERFDFEGHLDKIVEDITNPVHIRGPGWMSDTTPARLMPKAFNISDAEFRYHPLVQKFYNWDLDAAHNSYERQVLPRVALHQAMSGRPLRERVKEINKAFNEDIKAAERAGDVQSTALLKKFQRQITDDINAVEAQFLGKPDPRSSPGAKYWSNQIKRMNFGTMLGSVALVLPGDMIMSDIAQGSLGRGMRALWTAPQMRRALKDLEKGGQRTLRAILTMSEDARNLDLRQLKYGDIDTYGHVNAIGGVGTRAREASKILDATTQSISEIMMKINGMRPWNHYMKAGNGYLFMEQSLKNFSKFGKLSDRVRAAYARRGIDAAVADKLTALHKKHGNVKAGSLTMPNWNAMEIDDPVTMSRFHRAIRAVIRDAVPENEIGQTPLLAATPIGSVWLQFLSFPMMAKQIIGRTGEVSQPLSPLFMGAAMQGLLYAALGDWARHAIRGEGDAWLDQWNSPEGRSQILYTSYIRSPMASGFQGPLGELMVKAFADPLNEILEGQGIAPVVPGSGKFKDANFLSVIAGPTGTQFNRLFGLGRTAVGAVEDEDDRERLIRKGIHAAPFSSHPIFRGLEAYHFGE